MPLRAGESSAPCLMVGWARILNMEVTGRAPPGAPVCELVNGGRDAPAPEREGEELTLASGLLKRPLGKAYGRGFD